MKNTLLFSLGLIILSLGIQPVSAQVYQWKDENGRTVVSDTPPPGKYKAQRTQSAQAAPASTPPATGGTAAPAPKNAADKELDFKKRQQEAKEKADKEAKEEAAALQRKENCSRAREALRTLESSQPIASMNEKGERVIVDDQQRRAETERARQSVAEWCK